MNYIPHGVGTEYREDGTRYYCGGYANSMFHGNGIQYSPDGKKVWYEGEFENGKRHGEGVVYDPNEKPVFQGLFEDGEPLEGQFFYENGILRYEGGFKDYKPDGYGKKIYRNPSFV